MYASKNDSRTVWNKLFVKQKELNKTEMYGGFKLKNPLIFMVYTKRYLSALRVKYYLSAGKHGKRPK